MIRKLLINKYKKKIAKERKVIPDPIETCSLQIIDPQLIDIRNGSVTSQPNNDWKQNERRL